VKRRLALEVASLQDKEEVGVRDCMLILILRRRLVLKTTVWGRYVFESMYLSQNKKARLTLEAASTEDKKRF
jgi:hypothetical protein